MSDTPHPLEEIASALGDKAPNSIKEVVKVLNELIVKLVEATTEIKTRNTQPSLLKQRCKR
ncbi:hypothetical protein HPB48_026218 [Haemaphysalis longicornis]|uniref:Uncharacterized protein n=1 Tax=Haemaphysalis longicornis TaxID=44386 RepID=A0A9J6HBC4_HAELO|nr:hypothetical protein HPB48_026218 [Haemaphysalis longicornis]